MIALSLVFVQVTEAQEPKVKTIKQVFKKCIDESHTDDILTRMGAILATAIINCGGRNASISLKTRDGNLRQNAIIGMVMFTQYWYWYPCLNFLTLAMSPTALIGLNEDLKVPKSFEFVSNAKPSTFAYPEMLKKEVEEVKEKVETAKLSTTAKVAQRKKRGTTDSTSVKPVEEKKDEEMADATAEKVEEEKKPEQPEPLT